MSFQQPRLDATFAATGRTIIDSKLWNTLLQTLELRFQPLEAQQEDLVATENSLLAAGLSRINDILLPAAQKIFAILQNGFLIAHSSTSQTLVVGQQPTFVVPPGNERDLFVPSPFVTISRLANTTDFAFAQTVAYDATQGLYTCTILQVFGNAGPFADWVIQDGTGLAQAVQQWMTDTAASATAAHADRLAADADAAATAADRTATHSDRLAADGSALAAAASATAAAASAGTVDTTAFIRTDGTRAFTATQSGVAPAAGDRSGALVTSNWTGAEIATALAGLIASAPGALDTLKELADAIGDDPNYATTISTALSNRVRADVPQVLSTGRQAQARANMRVLSRGQVLALALAN